MRQLVVYSCLLFFTFFFISFFLHVEIHSHSSFLIQFLKSPAYMYYKYHKRNAFKLTTVEVIAKSEQWMSMSFKLIRPLHIAFFSFFCFYWFFFLKLISLIVDFKYCIFWKSVESMIWKLWAKSFPAKKKKTKQRLPTLQTHRN